MIFSSKTASYWDPGVKTVAGRGLNLYHNIVGSEREKVL
jgi:hypothetical protein